MANLLWGKVYYQEHFAGILRQEPGGGASFSYDPSYLEASRPAIAHNLPLQQQAHISHSELHPFFDNLVAEGWLEQVQTRLLGKRQASRFELLLAFGQDCAGAVSVVDPDPAGLSQQLLDLDNAKETASFTSRASLSGVQPKLAIIERGGKFYPAKMGEISTYIAKFSSRDHGNLLYNEYLTTQALQAFLPEDSVVELFIGKVEGQDEEALLIKRFDRKNSTRVHFEEFNQLLEKKSSEKYNGAHKNMADFIEEKTECLKTEKFKLYLRILAGLLLGNTDMHFKNFAMIHTNNGLRLSPAYDNVCAALYDYKTVALAIANTHNFKLSNLNARHIILLGEEFGMPKNMILFAVKQLEKNKPAAISAIEASVIGDRTLKNTIIDIMEKRWNGTFALIGKNLLQKP